MKSWSRLVDAALVILLLGMAGLVIATFRELDASRARENEMFVLANRLDKTAADWQRIAGDWEKAAGSFERAALSCLGTVKQYRQFFDNTSTMMPAPPKAVATDPPLAVSPEKPAEP